NRRGATAPRPLDSGRRSVVRTAHRLLEHREPARGPRRGAQERTGGPSRARRRPVAITQATGDRKYSAFPARRTRRPVVRPFGLASADRARPGRPAARGRDRDQWNGAGLRFNPLLVDRRRVRPATRPPNDWREFARESV